MAEAVLTCSKAEDANMRLRCNNEASAEGDRHGRLLDDDLGRLGDLGDLACGKLPVCHVRSATRTEAVHLGRRGDRDEDDAGLLDRRSDVGCEEKVLATWRAHSAPVHLKAADKTHFELQGQNSSSAVCVSEEPRGQAR